MRFFFKSRSFKILLASISAILAVVILTSVFINVSSPISSLIGMVATPFQKIMSGVSNRIDDYKIKIDNNEQLMAEIEELKKQNAALADKLTDYEETLKQNTFYEQFLGIKESNPEMLFQTATVTSKDHTDPYKSFTVNVGMLDGVELNDPVVTEEGLVGFVSEIAPTYSKITTILSPKLKAGGRDSRTADEGVCSGRADLAVENLCYIYNLQRDCSVSTGDYIITAGGSIFPQGLVVGKVKAIEQQTKDASLYAVLETEIDFDNLRNVMIITFYQGQGYIGPNGD